MGGAAKKVVIAVVTGFAGMAALRHFGTSTPERSLHSARHKLWDLRGAARP